MMIAIICETTLQRTVILFVFILFVQSFAWIGAKKKANERSFTHLSRLPVRFISLLYYYFLFLNHVVIIITVANQARNYS